MGQSLANQPIHIDYAEVPTHNNIEEAIDKLIMS